MSEMIIRVAEAISDADTATTSYEELARVAIEALRKPTPAMVIAWKYEVRPENIGRRLDDIFIERFWPAAIDAALKEQTK